MSLADFLQELQTQDNIIYSQPPESAIHIIPPEKVCTKIIPPEDNIKKSPTTIKLKIKQKNITASIPQEEKPVNIPTVSTVVDLTKNSIVKKPPPKTVSTNEIVNQREVTKTNLSKEPLIKETSKPEINSDEVLFIKSGTEISKKSIWMEYFNKAKISKKTNPIVDRMKLGKFTITPDNKVLLLPDYDIVGKDPDDVLKDKWF